jgi:hypothetical protein
MSERSTIRLANGGVMYDNGEYYAVCYPWKEDRLRSVDRMAIKLCELEDKLEQGNVVEVVRCKDCAYCRYVDSAGIYRCDRRGYYSEEVKPTDYCSYGERREE